MSAMLYSEILVFNNAGYSSYQQVGQIWFINRYSGSTLHRVVMRQENHQLKEIRNSQFFSVKFGGFFLRQKNFNRHFVIFFSTGGRFDRFDPGLQLCRRRFPATTGLPCLRKSFDV